MKYERTAAKLAAGRESAASSMQDSSRTSRFSLDTAAVRRPQVPRRIGPPRDEVLQSNLNAISKLGAAGLMRCWFAFGCGCAVLACAPESLAQRRAARGARTASVHWQQVPLGEGLQRIARTYGAVVFLDRRVDPTSRLTLDTRDADLTETLKQTAAAAGLGVSQVGPLSYVGPAATADALRTLAALRGEGIAKLPAASRAALVERRPIQWMRLAEPRAIVAEAVSARGWQLAGAERIPHDLWPAGELPPLPLARLEKRSTSARCRGAELLEVVDQ